MPTQDRTVGSLILCGFRIPVVGIALRVFLEGVVDKVLVAETLLRQRFLCQLLNMEIIHDEVASPSLIRSLISAVGTDTNHHIIAVTKRDIDNHSLHILRSGVVEASSMIGEGRSVVGIIDVIVTRCTVAVISLRCPVLNVTVGSLAIVGKQTGGAVVVLLNPHTTCNLIYACAQFLGRDALVQLQRLADGLS